MARNNGKGQSLLPGGTVRQQAGLQAEEGVIFCMGKIAIYPGSFDPITNGHLDLIQRGLKIFDEIIVAIAVNPVKQPLFTIEERVEMIRQVLNHHPRVRIDHFTGLLVDYVRRQNTNVILRGLRAVSDFDYEFQLALMNRRLAPEIETVFLMTSLKWVFLSSSILKEAVSLGGVLEDIVPPLVFQLLREKFGVK